MKLNPDFLMRQVAGETLLVPLCQGQDQPGLITLNETGAFVYRCLEQGLTQAAIVEALGREFDAPIEVIREDIQGLLEQFRKCRVLMD